jgi:hypothetical protein
VREGMLMMPAAERRPEETVHFSVHGIASP